MSKSEITTFIIQSPASFWDGTKQLPGTLELWPSQLVFCFNDFQKSHLNLKIPLADIEYAKVFMIYNIAKYGLKIQSKNDKVDLFVLEDCKKFCFMLNGARLSIEK